MSEGNKLRKTCRVCNSDDLVELFSLGEQYISNFVDNPDGIECPKCNGTGEYVHGNDGYGVVSWECECTNGKIPHPKCEIALQFCNNCTLIQQKWTAPQDFLYTRHYWYNSSTTQTMRLALTDIVHSCVKRVELKADDIVLDIGANSGELLKNYAITPHCPYVIRVAVEPAKNMEAECKKNCDVFIDDFWNEESYDSHMDAWQGRWDKERQEPSPKAKIITAIGMFYDLEDPNTFIADVKKVLHPEGIFVCQLMCAKQMLENMDVGNLSHEHLEFYTLSSLEYLLENNGLEIEDIEENKVNGGSYRLYVGHKNKEKSRKVSVGILRREEHVAKEIQSHVYMVSTWREWYKKLETYKSKLRAFIATEVDKGKTIFVYGSSTKGNVILQWLDVNNEDIPFAADKSEEKWGKYTVGSGIKIISEDEMRKQKPDYLLVLPYSFKLEFMEREKELMTNGTVMIFPLPYPHMIGLDGQGMRKEVVL